MNIGTREHADALTDGRDPEIRSALQWLTFAHLPESLRHFSAPFYQAAVDLLREVGGDSPELKAALNKLIEAKDAGVRAGIRQQQGRPGSVPRPQEVVDPPLLGNFGPGQVRPRPIRDEPQA
jgi:hypothetical protein